MGFFDFFKSKSSPGQEVQNCEMNQQLFKDITQDVAIFMHQVGITRMIGLSFLRNDQGFFEWLFADRINSPEVKTLKRQSEETYLFVLGMHAFGAGVYATGIQSDFDKGIESFSIVEMQKLKNDCNMNDVYGLALEQLGVNPNSRNKQVLDQIILTGIRALQRIMGKKSTEPQNIKAFMTVLYNAGVSMHALRK